MRGKFLAVLFVFFTNYPSMADEIKQPIPPAPPSNPVKPVVPNAPENKNPSKFPAFPPLPIIPNIRNQENGPVREIENYELTISEAFPEGDTQRNVANTIENGQYILYSNKTAAIKLYFKNGLQYVYHLRNPASKMEISPGVYRETYEVIVQAGKELLLDRYIGELYNNDESIIFVTIMGNDKVIVTLKFTRKTA